MAKILICPNKYVQGAGEMAKIADYAKAYGKKALVVITASGYKRIGATLEASFGSGEVGVVYDYFNGECSWNEINRLIEVMNTNGCDMVIGIGGGKILDTSKAVAHACKAPVIICPTIASTDAPCSALSVVYTDEGVFEEYHWLPANPNMVLMDTSIIAKRALEAGACTEAVEKVIEANTLLSGIGFESGGLAAAHAIHNGLTVLPECHHMYHGEKVAFGVITQLMLENVPTEELDEIVGFCIEVGLPVTLGELGVTEITDEKLLAVAEAATVPGETIHNMPFEVTAEKVVAAMKAADAYGRYLLSL